MPRKKPENTDVTKRLQTELQALIAFGCYDSNSILKCGKSANKTTIMEKILKMYMPADGCEDHMSHVEQLLEGRGKYTYLINKEECV